MGESGATYFYVPEKEIEYEELPHEIVEHVTEHIPYEDEANDEKMYTPLAKADQFITRNDPATGQAFLDVGGFKVLKGTPNTIETVHGITAGTVTAQKFIGTSQEPPYGEKYLSVGGFDVVRGSSSGAPNTVQTTLGVTAETVSAKQFLSSGDPPVGDAFLNLGGFKIVKGAQVNQVESGIQINTNVITADQIYNRNDVAVGQPFLSVAGFSSAPMTALPNRAAMAPSTIR